MKSKNMETQKEEMIHKEGDESSGETTKQELAEMYVDFLDQEKWWIVALSTGLGANINPFKKDAVEFLLSDNKAKSKQKKDFLDFDQIGNKLKQKLIEKATGGTFLEYNKTRLQKMKALINQYQNDQTKLQELKGQIEEGKDPTLQEVDQPSSSTPSQNQPSSSEIIPAAAGAGALAGEIVYQNISADKTISEEELQYLKENAQSTKEKLSTIWSLTNIKEVKDNQGNVILESKGESPYIHADAVWDLIWLSLIYYKKTNTPLILESWYRTIDHQEKLKKQNESKNVPTADAGYSGHNLGYSIDVSKNSRYEQKIGWVKWLQKIAKKFNFNPISTEDRHFDHKIFVDTYYKDKEARLPLAQKINEEYLQNAA